MGRPARSESQGADRVPAIRAPVDVSDCRSWPGIRHRQTSTCGDQSRDPDGTYTCARKAGPASRWFRLADRTRQRGRADLQREAQRGRVRDVPGGQELALIYLTAAFNSSNQLSTTRISCTAPMIVGLTTTNSFPSRVTSNTLRGAPDRAPNGRGIAIGLPKANGAKVTGTASRAPPRGT